MSISKVNSQIKDLKEQIPALLNEGNLASSYIQLNPILVIILI